jgi:hypothetical protein
MNQQVSIADQTPSGPENRQHTRARVLLGAVVATPDGETATDGIIRNLSARGASVYSSSDLPVGDQIYLLDTRNHRAYLGTIRWKKAKSAGVEFIRAYDLHAALPAELNFLDKLLIEAKLRQVSTLEKRGVDLEHAASIVGLSDIHLSRIGRYDGITREFGALLRRLAPFVETGAFSPTRIPAREEKWSQFDFFRRSAKS